MAKLVSIFNHTNNQFDLYTVGGLEEETAAQQELDWKIGEEWTKANPGWKNNREYSGIRNQLMNVSGMFIFTLLFAAITFFFIALTSKANETTFGSGSGFLLLCFLLLFVLMRFRYSYLKGKLADCPRGWDYGKPKY